MNVTEREYVFNLRQQAIDCDRDALKQFVGDLNTRLDARAQQDRFRDAKMRLATSTFIAMCDAWLAMDEARQLEAA